MKKLLILLVVAGFAISATNVHAPEQAVTMLKPYMGDFEEIAKFHDLDATEVLAIGFPEAVKYEAIKDFLEQTTLRLTYVEFGTRRVDFSTGIFQPKISYIETLENMLSRYPDLKTEYNSLLIPKRLEGREAREQRLKNLDDPSMQFQYLCAFYEVMEKKYANKEFFSIKEKIRFYATAYNWGFTRAEHEITDKLAIAIFPYGPGGQKIRYADYSVSLVKRDIVFFNEKKY